VVVTEGRPEESGQVTLVLPTRNRSSLLRHPPYSIAVQHDVATTILVVDEAPTDDTPVLVAGMPGIRLIRHDEPTEQRIDRNHVNGVATTPRLAFRDDDDLWAPTELRTQRRRTPFPSF
jgi:hypothetical protein